MTWSKTSKAHDSYREDGSRLLLISAATSYRNDLTPWINKQTFSGKVIIQSNASCNQIKERNQEALFVLLDKQHFILKQ